MFRDYQHALNFYTYCNPARFVQRNLLEQERRQKPRYDDFDPKHPHRVYAVVALAFKSAQDAATARDKEIFVLYTFKGAHYTDIMTNLGVSKDMVYRALGRIRKNVLRILENKGLYSENN